MIKKKLGKIVSISKGKKHSTAEAVLPSSRRIIGINDLRNDDKIAYTNDRIGTEVFPEDLMIAWDGANAGTIGFGKTGFIGSTIVRLRLKEKDKFHTAFIGAFLKTQFDYLRKTATGATIPHISRSALEGIEIPQFEIEDQIRIATLLSRVEALIATRKDNLRLLDEFLKSTFLKMFGDPVRNKEGWDTTPLSKIGQFFSGGTPSKKRDDFWRGEFPWVSPKDMKVPYISDAQDHISEKVFEETSLRRIAPEHLLIVVRGMILAHSFPIAINTVPVAINQDMKAILPSADNNVHYLMACLNAMKRQVLTLISSAGHGTKRFDSLAMDKLLVPSPSLDIQNKFAAIVIKVKPLKTLYHQSLSELENLYGTLSQKAFKGKLDLSRIPLGKVPEETVTDATPETADQFPEPDSYDMSDPAARENFLRQLFDAFIAERKGHTFSMEVFWTQAEQKVLEHMDDEGPPLGVADYDKAKEWLFELIKSGNIRQLFYEENNYMGLSIKR